MKEIIITVLQEYRVDNKTARIYDACDNGIILILQFDVISNDKVICLIIYLSHMPSKDQHPKGKKIQVSQEVSMNHPLSIQTSTFSL